jgi:AcrR family transcriptional regulator
MMSRQTLEGTARPSGRPRSAKAEKAIVEATLDLIGEGMGVSDLSIEAIAARARVGKTTIYRRWSNKEDLVADALATLKAPLPPPAGASVRADLVAYLEAITREARDVRARCIFNLAMNESERYPRLLQRFREVAIEPRRAMVRAVLVRGMASGELRPDLDMELTIAMLNGTVVWHTKWAGMVGEELPAELPERVVDQVLAGIMSRPGGGDDPSA